MLIALPNCQGRVSPVLDVAARLVLIRFQRGSELERREVVLFEKETGGMVQALKELGIGILICGALSQGLQLALERAGIRVWPQVCGEIEAVIAAYRSGTLNRPEFTMPGCCPHSCGSIRSGSKRPVRAH
jgi:predicted Fe-Mo cluster-binding NifX family protein